MTLDSITFPPLSGGRPEQMIVLVHGIADSARGMMKLAQEVRGALPDAVCVMPHAPQAFDRGPTGLQWFSMKDWRENDPSILPALINDMETSADLLNGFIDEKLKQYGLDDSRLAIVGYSQGASMGLFAGTRRKTPAAGIVAFSGRYVSEVFNRAALVTKPPVLALHGADDTVIKVSSHFELVADFKKLGVPLTEQVLSNMGHRIDDPRQLAQGIAFLKKLFAGGKGEPVQKPAP